MTFGTLKVVPAIVEPLKKRHMWDNHFVLCRKVVLPLDLRHYGDMTFGDYEGGEFNPCLYRRFYYKHTAAALFCKLVLCLRFRG